MINPIRQPKSQPLAETSFVSEIFHELSQPLTAIHCQLELSLRRDETIDQFRDTIETVLENAERMRQRLLLIRALNDTADSEGSEGPTELNGLLKELQETLLPLFEANGKTLTIALPPRVLFVHGDRAKLMRALFYFAEYLFRYAQPGPALEVEASDRSDRSAQLRIASGGSLPVGLSDDGRQQLNSLELELAQKTFRAAGGDLRLISWDATHSEWLAHLPVA